MANASFTRDEVILALDVLYFSGEERLTEESPAIVELSDLLNKLPIHSMKTRRRIFRNPSGVLNQIKSFQRSKANGKKDVNVGVMFYKVAGEYEGCLKDLHSVAMAIRRNIEIYSEFPFGAQYEDNLFPEGVLLGHLHRLIEHRDGVKIVPEKRCSICHIDTCQIYQGSMNLMEVHLISPVTEIDGKKQYGKSEFITVCPNCHAALHKYRPWILKENLEQLLG